MTAGSHPSSRNFSSERQGQALFRVLADCSSCKVQSAMVEEVACRGAEILSLEATCRLCGRREKAGRCVRAGSPISSLHHARTLLEMWAAREGETDSTRFAAASFAGLDLDAVASRLVRGADVPTSFDPFDALNPESLEGDGGRPPIGSSRASSRPTRYRPVLPQPAGAPPLPPRRTAARVLVSVLAASGSLRPGARAVLDRLLEAACKPPLAEAELRSWRSQEIPVPEDPEPLLGAAACLAELEGPPDGAAWVLVSGLARAWGSPLSRLKRQAAEMRQQRGPGMVRLWYALRDLLAVEPG